MKFILERCKEGRVNEKGIRGCKECLIRKFVYCWDEDFFYQEFNF